MVNLNHINTKIGVLDTSICSMNVGDFIIMDSCYKVISELFPNAQKIHFPTHERITRVGLKRQKEIGLNFLCGTNCLNSSMFLHRQWNVGYLNSILMKPVVSLGVGWGNYQNAPDFYTKTLLKKIFSNQHFLSVRDSYTEEKFKLAGLKNVINTSCSTMWTLTPEHCQLIPQNKADDVVFTLTDYRKNKEFDLTLIRSLKNSYKNVYFWAQGSQDYNYFMSFNNEINDINVIPANLKSFDSLLDKHMSLDFVGTRLHAGIRALQKGKRTTIISVDNRAEEKKKDFNLNVIPRDWDISTYIDFFNNSYTTNIKIPLENITKWRSQFE